MLRAAGFRSSKIVATYEFVLEAGPSELRALLGDERGEADQGLVRTYAEALFVLAERGEIDLPTAIGRVGLVRVAFVL